MNNVFFIDNLKEFAGDLLAIPIYEGKIKRALALIPDSLAPIINYNVNCHGFTGAFGEMLSVTTNGAWPIPKVILYGLGLEESSSEQTLREAGGGLAAHQDVKTSSKIFILKEIKNEKDSLSHFAFGMMLRFWQFDKYRYQRQQLIPKVYLSSNKSCQELLEYYKHLYEGVALARELTAEPANRLPPSAFASRCHELGSRGLHVDVVAGEELQTLGAHALYAVGKGSSEPSQLVTLQWQGGGVGTPTIALVGKGVCYDSGGINIKTEHLTEMKWDKAAAAAVVGTLLTLASLKAPVNVVGVIGLVENMPDGAALKPGDVIDTLAGKSVEIVDTDNEGRLVLADCLWHAQSKFSPQVMIDLGTLTLETMGALGSAYAGLFCEDTALQSALVAAGQASGEKVWPLPMGEPFASQICSSVAEIKNIGTLGYGESSAAAEFLKCFVRPEVRWAHLDIAGTAWSQEDRTLSAAGVTGFGVQLLTEWILG